MISNKDTDISLIKSLQQKIFGSPKDIDDPKIFHKLALIPTLAWIGLGADGLSSSSYGPEEAFRALGNHTYLALFLGLATMFTVFIISYSYSRIIEHFPSGGGGYVVATHTLGEKAGVVSGSALLVDYVLTITVSIVSCGDAVFSFLPVQYHPYKIYVDAFLIIALVILNIRGVKESVTILAPIFVVFILSHILLISYGVISHLPYAKTVAHNISNDFNSSLSTLGWFGMIALFLRAYSIGGGTYTGIEAVSNGLQIMKEPRVQTAKRTMIYMSLSLSITAFGIYLCYLLFDVHPVAGQTLNAILAKNLFSEWSYGHTIALITIFSEGALLVVAAQAGFIDGPRIMANMAVDAWFPRKYAALSERLTMRNGIAFMGIAALILLIYTKGSISTLIVMYSINVFLTFSLSQLGMCNYFVKNKHKDKKWKTHIFIHIVGFLLCATILIVTAFEKFKEGGWLTIVVTSLVIILCYLIKGHYNSVRLAMKKLDFKLKDIQLSTNHNVEPVNKNEMTAIQLVSGFNSFGVNALLSIINSFPGLYKNIIFVSVSVVDSGSFKGSDEVKNLKDSTVISLKKYVDFARNLGVPADYRYDTGIDIIDAASTICLDTSKEFLHSTVFAGQLIFQKEKFYHKLLHNDISYNIQKRLLPYGITTVVIPITVEQEDY